MTGIFAGSAFFFFLSARRDTGTASVRLRSTSHATRLLRLRFGYAPALEVIGFLLTKLSACQILVAARTECHVVGLILDQKIGLRRRMRLVTRQAINLGNHLGD